MGWSALAVESAQRNRGIGAEMPGQIERQLHARREFRKALVDAELEIEGAVLMPQHDAGGHRRLAGPQRHDLALAGGRERRRGAADEAGIAVVLHQRGAALGFPAAGFQLQEGLDRGGDVVRRARDRRNAPRRARRGGCAAGAAPSVSSARAPRAAIPRRRAWRRARRGHAIAARAAQAVAAQHLGERLHGGAVERHVAQDQRVGAGLRAPVQHDRSCRSLGMVAVEQRRATACHRDRR